MSIIPHIGFPVIVLINNSMNIFVAFFGLIKRETRDSIILITTSIALPKNRDDGN